MSRLTVTAFAALALSTASFAQVTAEQGFEIAGSIDLASYCGSYPAIHVFSDGSLLVFDGSNISHRTPDGTVLRDYGTFAAAVYTSFLEVDEASDMAYFGESSTSTIRSLDLVSGQIAHVTTLTFNFDLAFDVVPGLAYVTASASGSGTNAVFRVDLLTGQTVQIADIGGYSGPIEVDNLGNVFVTVLPGTFPYPADATYILRFDASQVTGSTILTLGDGTVHSSGYDGMSSSAYDPVADGLIVVETNTGATGFGSIAWRLHPNGDRAEAIATMSDYAGKCQVVNGNMGTVFAGYQPANASVRLQFSECWTTGESGVYNATPKRPSAVFTGPGTGNMGPATVDIEGGIPNGYASLWIARSGAYEFLPVLEDIGGLYPVALRANAVDFGRRFGPLPLSSTGFGSFSFTQAPSIEGGILFQWIVMDANMDIVTTSSAVINR